MRKSLLPTKIGRDPRWTWRAAASFAAAIVMSASLVPTVHALKGGGLFPAGTYHLDFAGTSYSGFANNVQLNLDVSTGTEIARPDGAPETTTSNTVVFLNLNDYNTFTFTFACVVLDHPSDFAIDKRLGSATLNTTLTPSTPTCFGPPLATSIGINATWLGVGPLANSTGVSNYSCAGYNAESSGHGLDNTATGSLAVTIGGTTTTFPPAQSGLNSNAFDVEAHGAIEPGCGPTGFGIGPTPAGHYKFNGLFANGFFAGDFGGFNQVSLFDNNQSSQHGGGPATASSEFDLSASFFGGPINGFGCFAIPAGDVTTNGLSSASVNTTVAATTPFCSNSFPGFGLNFPLTVSATWTASGPTMTVHDQNNYQCLGYTESTSTFVTNVGANSVATVTMPDYFGNLVTLNLSGGFGSLTQVEQSIQANGVLPISCLIRG